MTTLQYLFLAFIQAATEFLPISSSGHLLFLKGILNVQDTPIIFDVIVHTGSLLAIILFYQKSFRKLMKDAAYEMRHPAETKKNTRFIIYLAISTVVTFVFYVLLKNPIESKVQTPAILPVTFFVTTVILLSTLVRRNMSNRDQISSKPMSIPILIGLFQGVAILPGISRSGSTISPLLLLGVKREEAAFYSFSLAVPAIFGALVLKLSDLESVTYISENWLNLSLSFIVSGVFSYLFLWALTLLIKKGVFWTFGIYTAIMAVISLILF